MKTFSRTPGGAKHDAKGMEKFIGDAGKPAVQKEHPWIGLDDTKRRELYNIRLTEAEKAKLEFIVENTKFKSMQEYCMGKLGAAIDDDIKRLTNSDEA